MRLRILIRPTGTIDGISLDHFQVGGIYEVGTQIACFWRNDGRSSLLPTAQHGHWCAHRPPSLRTSNRCCSLSMTIRMCVGSRNRCSRRTAITSLWPHTVGRHSPTARTVSGLDRPRPEHAGHGWLAVPQRATTSARQNPSGDSCAADERGRRRRDSRKDAERGRSDHETIRSQRLARCRLSRHCAIRRGTRWHWVAADPATTTQVARVTIRAGRTPL